MLFNIYIMISVITFIYFLLYTKKTKNKYGRKYGLEFFKIINHDDKNLIGIMLSWLKLFIMSFTPIINIFLVIIVFFDNEIDGSIEKMFLETIQKENK